MTTTKVVQRKPATKRAKRGSVKFRVYLAGPLQGCSLVEAERWRRLLTEELAKHDIEGISPPAIDWYAEPSENRSPCQVDLDTLRTCNVLYSYLTELSAGTIVEMYVAKYQYQIPVVTRCRIVDPSPFIEFCTTASVKSRQEAIKELVRLKGEKQ